MAKWKAKAKNELTIEDLLELAQSLGLSEGDFDDELEDACEHEKHLRLKKIKDALLWDQLDFLVDSGYALQRLEEIIRQLADGESKTN